MPGNAMIRRPAAGEHLTLEALAGAANLHPQLVQHFVAYGLIEPLSSERELPCFDASAVLRLRKIRRLRGDLGINLPGIAAVLDLLDRIEALQRELSALRARTGLDS